MAYEVANGSSTIQADYELLGKIASHCSDCARITTTGNHTIMDQLHILQNGNWEGDAADQFFVTMLHDVMPAFERLTKSLQAGEMTVNNLVSLFQGADEEAAMCLKFQDDPIEGTSKIDNVMYRLAPNPDGAGWQQNGDKPEPYALEDVEQSELNVFFSQYDGNDRIPPDIIEKYLNNEAIQAHQTYLIEMMIAHLEATGKPLTPEEVYEIALDSTGDPGTALIVAHNVTKAMARGSNYIDWIDIQRRSDGVIYTLNGVEYEFLFEDYPDATTQANNRESAFYLLLSPDEFGTADPGDYYHYYLNAAAAYYGATGQADFGEPWVEIPADANLNPSFDTRDVEFSVDNLGWDFWNADVNIDTGVRIHPNITPSYERATDAAVDGVMRDLDLHGTNVDADRTNVNAFTGWTWANALSYNEGSVYGSDYGGQPETIRESNIHREGALFGLQVAGVAPGNNWRWYIPISGSTNMSDGILGAGAYVEGTWRPQVNEDTFQILDSSGNLIFGPSNSGNSTTGGR